MTARVLFIFALLIGSAGCTGVASEHRSDATPAGSLSKIDRIRQEHLPNVELVTHEGQPVRFYDDLVQGKVVAINFMFTTCGNTCPLITERLAAAYHALRSPLKEKVTLLSITLEPEHDTPGVLRQYRKEHGIDAGWIFLTGRREDIERLRRSLGVYDLDPAIDSDPSQHAGLVVLGNEPQGRWKSVSAFSQPIRIRQTMERTILPPSEWPTGPAVVQEVAYQERDSSEPADLASLPAPFAIETSVPGSRK